MDTVEFLKGLERITEGCEGKLCMECEMNEFLNSLGTGHCIKAMTKFPELAIDFVEQWVKEHPVKTYKDVLLEKFPKATIEGNFPEACAKHIFGFQKDCSELAQSDCIKCWNQSYKEGNYEGKENH